MKSKLDVISGTPLQRIRAAGSDPLRAVYSQETLQSDLDGGVFPVPAEELKYIQAPREMRGVESGDVVYSSAGKNAAVVRPEHEGYLLSQNFMTLKPTIGIDPGYLVYLLNEDPEVRARLFRNLATALVTRVTARDLAALKLTSLPPLEIQQAIGQVYLDQKKLTALRKQNADRKEQLVFTMLKERDK